MSTSSTSSCSTTRTNHYSGFVCYNLCAQISLRFLCLTSVSGLGMKTGGLIFRVRSLKSHSPITYCTGILQTQTHRSSNIWMQIYTKVSPDTPYLERRLEQSFHTCSVFSRLRNSVNFPWSTLSICLRKWHVRAGRDALRNIQDLRQNKVSTHSFSPEQMSNNVVAGVVWLRHASLLKVPPPQVQSLKCCDPARREGWGAERLHRMGPQNALNDNKSSIQQVLLKIQQTQFKS